MSPWRWRFAGLGGGIAMIGMASALTMTPANDAEGSVCFVTPAGCYCVDFFLTDIKEMIIEKAQEAVQEKINEQTHYKDYGVKEFSPDIGIGTVYQDTEESREYRKTVSEAFGERVASMPGTSGDVEEVDPTGETRAGKERIVSRVTQSDPKKMAPYGVSREPGSSAVSAEEVAEWSDRMLLETEAVDIPNDEELSRLPMAKLDRLYDDARYSIMTNYSRHLMQELAASQGRIKSFEKAREALEEDFPVIGAAESATVHATMLGAAIKAEQIESQVRREQAMALMVGLQHSGDDGGGQ